MNLGEASFIIGVGLIIYLILVLSYWQVFYKAGYAGWKSIIPIYNQYILSKIAKQPTWVFVSLFIPVVSLIGSVLISLGVAKGFGKGALFAIVGLVLFPYFGYMYLGWGQSEYSLTTSED